MKYIIVLLVCFLTSNICAGTIDPNIPDIKYIEYAKNFHYIGLINTKLEDGSVDTASVVAYKPKIIITSAHVFNESKKAKVFLNNKNMEVKIIKIYDKYIPRKTMTIKDDDLFENKYYDIAVCLLDKDIGLEWYPDLYSNQDEKDKLCSISGFGITGTFIEGANKKDFKKRAGSNIIYNAKNDIITCSPSVYFNKTKLEFLIAPGDSGGGLFIDNKLAGISCGTYDLNNTKIVSGYGTIGVHLRISVYKEWIEKITDELMKENND
jgi:hypothetical protein